MCGINVYTYVHIPIHTHTYTHIPVHTHTHSTPVRWVGVEKGWFTDYGPGGRDRPVKVILDEPGRLRKEGRSVTRSMTPGSGVHPSTYSTFRTHDRTPPDSGGKGEGLDTFIVSPSLSHPRPEKVSSQRIGIHPSLEVPPDGPPLPRFRLGTSYSTSSTGPCVVPSLP